MFIFLKIKNHSKLTNKNTELFENMKSFNLVIPEELNTVSILANNYLTDY